MEKKKVITILANAELAQKVDSLMIQWAMPSKSSTVTMAIAMAYQKTFPNYDSKPVPMSGSGTQKQVVNRASQRVNMKTALSKAREDEILGSGKQLCTAFLKGSVIGLGGDINVVRCDYKYIDGVDASPSMNDMRLAEMPILGDWESDLSAREFVLANIFPKFKWNEKRDDLRHSRDPKKEHKDALEMNVKHLIIGIERGNITPNDVSIEALDLLVERLDEAGVNTDALKQAILDGGFR